MYISVLYFTWSNSIDEQRRAYVQVLRHLLTPILEKEFGTESEFLQALQTQMEVLKKNLDPAESKILQQLQVELQTTADTELLRFEDFCGERLGLKQCVWLECS